MSLRNPHFLPVSPPDDDRDNVWWLEFTLLEAAAGLEAGAVISGYEDHIGGGTLFAPIGRGALMGQSSRYA